MLSDEQLKQFDRDGFLTVEDVVSPANILNVRSEYDTLLDELTLRFDTRTEDWSKLSLDEKLTHMIVNHAEIYEHLDISLPLVEDLGHDSGMHAGPAVFNLLTNLSLLSIAESVMGPEILSNPVQHARIKPPESALSNTAKGNSNMARTGWHQDAAVVVEAANDSPMLTVWVAMTDATPEMGCMQAIPGSHRWADMGIHCPGRSGVGEIFIPEELVSQHKPVDLAVKSGGVVLLHRNTWHGAGPNVSGKVRWSFDLRYQPPGFDTGRQCFPEFLAKSDAYPDKVLTSATEWRELWEQARREIANGQRDATFNERWNIYRNDPLCA